MGVEVAVERALAVAGIDVVGPPVPLGRHADRPVTRWPTSAGDLVVKQYCSAEQAARAHADATTLWHSSLGVDRRPAGLAEPVLLLEEPPAAVSRALAGQLLPADDPARLQPWLAGVAELLAALHAADRSLPRRRSGRAVLRSMRRKLTDLEGTPAVRQGRDLAGLFDAAPDDLFADERLVPTHGDADPQNVLATPHGLCLVDWDRAALGSPARDLAQFGAAVWARVLVRGGTPSWATFDQLVAAYRLSAPVPGRRVLELYRACALVRVAHGWSVFRRQPDLAVPVLVQAAAALRAAADVSTSAARHRATRTPSTGWSAVPPVQGAGSSAAPRTAGVSRDDGPRGDPGGRPPGARTPDSWA